VFVHDLETGITTLASVDSAGLKGNGDSTVPSISADGRFVAFNSVADNLVPGDTNTLTDVFLHDRLTGTTERISLATDGAQGNLYSFAPSVSADGRWTGFYSEASNLVAGDTNGSDDVFIRDRDATGFTNQCDPGSSGVIGCPCSNPPSGPDRGCDNSSSTGGATLMASGIAYLSMDNLAFTTSGEKPNALSIVMQGNGSVSGGVVYGQGVRCLGGTIIRRLYTKAAVGGVITAPDFGSGDPAVSVRSSLKGDDIQPGQSRYYLVYYRDPVVLGGCPASRTFKATQTGRVDWSL
jgi:hypothetical protein